VDLEVGARERLPALLEELAPTLRPAVITDRNVARAVTTPLKAPTLVVPAGEGAKTRARWRALTDRLLDLGFGRDTVVVALGGGVVGDLAGFVAATFQRGVPVLQVPTSLLAMVDAAVGGKTALNTHHGKNLVGAFHPPIGVLIDPGVAGSLRSSHLRNGLVEALKHGLVADAAYFDWIEAERTRLLARDPAALTELIRRSVEIKAEIVSADEREAGRRAILNAGHTVGHALEAAAGYRLAHGEAVAVGLVVEALLGESLGEAPAGLAAELAARLGGLGLGLVWPEAVAEEAVLAAMGRDKKVVGGVVRFALPRAPGRLAGGPPWTRSVAESVVRQTLGVARAWLAAAPSTRLPHGANG
jgi:3-dehydroquinate synthase